MTCQDIKQSTESWSDCKCIRREEGWNRRSSFELDECVDGEAQNSCRSPQRTRPEDFSNKGSPPLRRSGFERSQSVRELGSEPKTSPKRCNPLAHSMHQKSGSSSPSRVSSRRQSRRPSAVSQESPMPLSNVKKESGCDVKQKTVSRKPTSSGETRRKALMHRSQSALHLMRRSDEPTGNLERSSQQSRTGDQRFLEPHTSVSRPSRRCSLGASSMSCRNLSITNPTAREVKASPKRSDSTSGSKSPQRKIARTRSFQVRRSHDQNCSGAKDDSLQLKTLNEASCRNKQTITSSLSPSRRKDESQNRSPCSYGTRSPLRPPTLSSHFEATGAPNEVDDSLRPVRRFSTGSTQVTQGTVEAPRLGATFVSHKKGPLEPGLLSTSAPPRQKPSHSTVQHTSKSNLLQEPVHLDGHAVVSSKATVTTGGVAHQQRVVPANLSVYRQNSLKNLRNSFGWTVKSYRPSDDLESVSTMLPSDEKPTIRLQVGGGNDDSLCDLTENDDIDDDEDDIVGNNAERNQRGNGNDNDDRQTAPIHSGQPRTSTIQIDLSNPSKVDYYFFKPSPASESCR